jgi:hypothetical protein
MHGVKIVKTDEEGPATSATKAVFALIHGGWHNRASFYADVSESEFAHAASQLHYDKSNAGALALSEITPGRFGTVPRYYIRCTQDRAIPLAGQDHTITTVDGAIGA